MKKTITSFAVAACLGLTACAGTATPEPLQVPASAPSSTAATFSAPTPVETASATPEPSESVPDEEPVDPDSIFNRLVSAKWTEVMGSPLVGSSGEKYLASSRKAAHRVCEALDSGVSMEVVLRVLVDTHDGNKKLIKVSAYAIGVGISQYCPEHTDELDF